MINGPKAQIDPKVENLQILFKKLYADADGKEKFDLKDNKQRYLAHAILQIALYSMNQQCGISFGIIKGCINDGASATPMAPESFKTWMTSNLTNPVTREKIKPETFYFYNCHIEADKYNNNNTNRRYGHNFDQYNTQYQKAKLILLGLINIDEDLPQEIREAISNVILNSQSQESLQSIVLFVQSAQSAEEIKDLLEKVVQKNSDQPLGQSIEGILKHKKFANKFNEDKEGLLTNLKNFVIASWLSMNLLSGVLQ